MNKYYKKILFDPLNIFALFLLAIVQYYSTIIIRQAHSLNFKTIFFSALVGFYSYGVIPLFFIILKNSLFKIYDNPRVILKYQSFNLWYKSLNVNSLKILFIFLFITNISPFIAGISYKYMSSNDLLYLLFQ